MIYYLSDVEKHINALTADLETEYSDKVRDRLLDLVVDDEPVSLKSITYFIGFLKEHKPSYPGIVISGDGNISAEWHQDNNNLITINFLPTGDCKVMSFLSNEDGKTDRISYKAKIGAVMADTKYSHFFTA